MLSESVHSIADCSNEIVLMAGGRFSKHKTDGDHPFGLYRAKYLASFVVATLLFFVGGFFSTSEAVKKSFDLCVNAKTDTDKLKAIYSWIVSNVSYDYDKASSVKSGYLPSVDSTLSEKKGICFDYAALMACMLRAQRIPAKLVVGTVSAQDMNHAWNEVYLEGKGWVTVKLYFAGNQWKRMDATFGTAQTSEMDSYIQTDSNYTALRIY